MGHLTWVRSLKKGSKVSGFNRCAEGFEAPRGLAFVVFQTQTQNRSVIAMQLNDFPNHTSAPDGADGSTKSQF